MPAQIAKLFTKTYNSYVVCLELEAPLDREAVYHLAASGLVKEIELFDPSSGRRDWLDGSSLARLVDAVNVERASKIAVTVELKTSPKVTGTKAVRS